jgi:hypothetical protein
VPAPPPEQPADLDTPVDLLDAELEKLDKLKAKEAEFPSTIADIESKLKELENQDLSTLEALESRQAQQGKLANTLVLANGQAKKTKAAITAQTEIVLKIGAQANSLAQQLWGSLHREAYDRPRTKLDELFFHAYEHQDVLERYKPLALLQWLRFLIFSFPRLIQKTSGFANCVRERIGCGSLQK